MYTLQNTDANSSARAGTLTIGQKELQTPFFMAVATKAALKALTPEQAKEAGAQCIISNGFIMSLKPGVEIIKAHGGIHNFMNWHGGVFTDSGGFQVLLDEFFVKRSPEGIVFKNPFTGQKDLFNAEKSIKIQNDIGSDVAMAFDDVARYGFTKDEARSAMQHSHQWAHDSLKAHRENKNKTNPDQLIFGICHGNTYADLRVESVNYMRELDFDGFAIGGVAIGESTNELYEAIDIQAPLLPEDKARYVMGLGSPIELLEAIGKGCDCFDSIFPAQSARRGTLFSRDGPVRIKSKNRRVIMEPIDKECQCYTCQNYTQSYISLTIKTHEYLGYTLATIHNMHFLHDLMKDARKAILENRFVEFKETFIARYMANEKPKDKDGGSYFQYAKKNELIQDGKKSK